MWCCFFFVSCLWSLCICVFNVWVVVVWLLSWSCVWVCVFCFCIKVVLVVVVWFVNFVIVLFRVFNLFLSCFMVKFDFDLVEFICVLVLVVNWRVRCFIRLCKVLLIECVWFGLLLFFLCSFFRYLWIVVLELVLFNLICIVFMVGCCFMVSSVFFVFLILDLYSLVCVMWSIFLNNELYVMYLYLKWEVLNKKYL